MHTMESAEPAATKIYDSPARFYARSGTSTALGAAGYFVSLFFAGHPHAAQSALITAINAGEGFGKTYGGIEYEKWCSTKQFGRASQADQAKGITDDKWYRAPVKATGWFIISTLSDCLTNTGAFWLACGDPKKGLQFTLIKSGARLAESLLNESVWGAIPWGKERVPADEARKPYPPLYKEAWSVAKVLCKKVFQAEEHFRHETLPHLPQKLMPPARLSGLSVEFD